MFLCILNHLTFVPCLLLQCYIFCPVLNSVARLLVCASTQSLCRFIHRVSYSTCMVISTLFPAQCLLFFNIIFKGFFRQSFTACQHCCGSFSYPLKLFLFKRFFFFICVYRCIYVYTCIHIEHCLSVRYFYKLFVHCEAVAWTFSFRSVQLWRSTMSYNSCKAMCQVYNKYCLLYCKTLVSVKRHFLTWNAIQTSNENKFKKKITCFRPSEIFILLSYHWRLCFMQLLTILLASVLYAHLAYLIQQPKL